MKNYFKSKFAKFHFINAIKKRIKVSNLEKKIILNLPWSKKKWYYEALKWVEDKLKLNREIIIDIEDHRFWELSHTICFTTNKNNSYFFKASDVSGVFANEANIYSLIKKLTNNVVPELVSADEVRGWILTKRVGKKDTESGSSYTNTGKLYKGLSSFHIRSLDYKDDIKLMKLPMKDLMWVLSTIKKLMEFRKELKIKESVILRVDKLLPGVEKKIKNITSIGMPNTLIHGDLHDCNIVYEADDYYWLDWANVCVTFPLLDLRALYYKKIFSEYDITNDLNSYFESWLPLVKSKDLTYCWDNIFSIIPLFNAAVHYQILENKNFEPGSFQGVVEGLLQEFIDVETGHLPLTVQ